MAILQSTIEDLQRVAIRHSEILVSYSGGKDSLVVIDLCSKIFPTVKAFFWYAVPDLEVCNAQIRFAKERWGVDVVQIPHWDMLGAMKEGVWCDIGPGMDKMPDIDLKQGYAYAMDVCGVGICATGMKDSDGLPRRHFFANIRDGGNRFWERLLHPLRGWNKKDVTDYCRVNGIPIPTGEKGAVTSGVGFGHDALCWLHDAHPADFEKLVKWFPYAGAAIKRRDWFGV